MATVASVIRTDHFFDQPDYSSAVRRVLARKPALFIDHVDPTVLADVKPSMHVVREEIFGPFVVAQLT